jgi:hypothetical protein
MTKFSSPTKHVVLLIVILIMKNSFDMTRMFAVGQPIDDNVDLADSYEIHRQQREYDLQNLRHFLLTSNDEQRANKRRQQDLSKREWVSTTYRFVHTIYQRCSFSFVDSRLSSIIGQHRFQSFRRCSKYVKSRSIVHNTHAYLAFAIHLTCLSRLHVCVD